MQQTFSKFNTLHGLWFPIEEEEEEEERRENQPSIYYVEQMPLSL